MSVDSTTVVHAGTSFVNSNAILEKVLQNLLAENRGKIVLRCEELPFFPGQAADLETLFRCLIQPIVAKQEDVAKRYLHISCSREDGDENGSSLSYYNILFHANLDPDPAWQQCHRAQVEEVLAILRKYNGGLVQNLAKSSGCLFSVSLPGKFL